MWLDLILEYLAGFGFGLFIFQSLFMKSMMGGTYLANVRNTFLPEFISMNFMMAGMAPVMSFLMMGRDMRAMESSELLFWGVMSLGVIVGFVTAYPANVWMVARKLKHGLMTVRATRKESRSGREAKSARVASAGHEPKTRLRRAVSIITSLRSDSQAPICIIRTIIQTGNRHWACMERSLSIRRSPTPRWLQTVNTRSCCRNGCCGKA